MVTQTTEKWIKEPIKPTGILKQYDQVDITPSTGTEFTKLQIKDLLNAPNSDELFRELAFTISNRGVVFFKDQNDLTLAQHKEFVKRVADATGRPKECGFHVHPSGQGAPELVLDKEAADDPEVFVVSNRVMRAIFGGGKDAPKKKEKKGTSAARQYHTDTQWEVYPADYSCLWMSAVPPTGGDTIWANAYEMYDRLSEPLQKYLSTLKVFASSPTIKGGAEKSGFKVITENRGHPENCGDNFTAEHTVIRTNPVTGRNGIYAVGLHIKEIMGVTAAESEYLLKMFLSLITENHDLQCRYKWSKGALAIWDNAAVFHAATPDFDIHTHEREGRRITTIGDKAYFDPYSFVHEKQLEEEENKRLAEAYGNGGTNGSSNGNGVKSH